MRDFNYNFVDRNFFKKYFFSFIISVFCLLYIFIKMRIQNKKILASILFVLISFVCSAQGVEPPPPSPPPPPGLPIDGSLPILIILALVFGVYRKAKSVKNSQA